MSIYYSQGSYIVADRYPNNDHNTYNDVVPLSGVSSLGDADTSFVPNPYVKAELSQLSYSSSFGYDHYVNDGTAFKPIYILYNKLYQNDSEL